MLSFILKNYNEEAGIILSTHLISDVEKVLDGDTGRVCIRQPSSRKRLFLYLNTTITKVITHVAIMDNISIKINNVNKILLILLKVPSDISWYWMG